MENIRICFDVCFLFFRQGNSSCIRDSLKKINGETLLSTFVKKKKIKIKKIKIKSNF